MPKKLLLADDSITIQKVVGITLANEDLEIVSVDNGEDAITTAKSIRPDLVLADASMPRRDGYQVAEALKNDPATVGIPVLILAGQLEGHPDQGRLAACRADGFIPKPFESQMLIDRVRKILGLAGPAPRAVPAAAAAPAPRPATSAPVAAPRPAPPAPSAAAAAVTTPMPAAPRSPIAPTPMPGPAPLAAQAMSTPLAETDFGELSAAPAASGDQDLWGGDAPLASAGDENLWGTENSAEKTPNPAATAVAAPAPAPVPVPTPTPMPMPVARAVPAVAASTNGGSPESLFSHPDDSPELVTNAAELANIDKFGTADPTPSGLDLDTDAVSTFPSKRPGDDNLVHANDAAAADVLSQVPAEKLEAIVRDVVRQMIGPILEKIAWEVVPDLAEDLIRDELKRLTAS